MTHFAQPILITTLILFSLASVMGQQPARADIARSASIQAADRGKRVKASSVDVRPLHWNGREAVEVDSGMKTNTQDRERPVVVFDVLGTLVDQAGSLRRQTSAIVGCDASASGRVVRLWLAQVAERERQIIAGDSAFVPSHALDAQSLEDLAANGELPTHAVRPLSTAAQRMEPWPDTVDGLTRLSADATVAGLSNASHKVLTELSHHSGMRWHQIFSADDARTYKPDPAIYRLALSAAPIGAPPPYLVAAHAWDLRAAAKAGLRTAYVPRPDGDPPTPDDTFDLYAEDLQHLHAMLRD